jgi:hypothetical protein
VDQILAVVTDGVADGRLAFHPKDFYKTHKIQVEESKPYIVQYGTDRLPKYMQVCTAFEALRLVGCSCQLRTLRPGWQDSPIQNMWTIRSAVATLFALVEGCIAESSWWILPIKVVSERLLDLHTRGVSARHPRAAPECPDGPCLVHHIWLMLG